MKKYAPKKQALQDEINGLDFNLYEESDELDARDKTRGGFYHSTEGRV